MTWSLADARFIVHRATSLIDRGIVSLRTRGLRASWNRTLAQFRNLSVRPADPLYVPTDSVELAFAISDAPRASIVIPVFNQLAHTLQCLRALAEYPPSCATEVIVVDDGSTDATPQRLASIPGLRYHRRENNGGFIAACNDGAALAHGEFVAFLNNDTVPQPGWLDVLIDALVTESRAGLVGAQLRYPNGRLQEAGGVVFSDGNAWNYGRYESPEDPRYGYLRDADYVSGAAIALRRELFLSLGGFDAEYAPAYYEDTDLAFKVRAAGLRVVYQPASVVLHEEGATSGTDLSVGPKAYQTRNRDRFMRKHALALARHPASSVIPAPAVLHARQRQILVIDALTPAPDQDSGSLRLVNLMRLLRQEGAHVCFLPARLLHAGPYTHLLQHAGMEVWYAPFASRAPAWLREHGARFDAVVMCRHYIAREFLPLVRRHAPQARAIFDTVDLHYLREQRGAELARDTALARAASRTRRLELDVVARSDVTLVVSGTERDLLARDAPGAQVEVLSNLHQPTGDGEPFAHRRDLVFVGGFRHPPNVDAVRWFVERAFPLIHDEIPDARFHCIGGHVPPEVSSLSRHPGVVVHGHVPDIGPFMNGCRIALAPLRYGAGVKGKINLSMAHGQPVVATPVAVEGMHLQHGHDVLVAEDPADFAAEVIRLYRDETLWNRLSANGRENVRRHFSLDAARDTVRRVFFDSSDGSQLPEAEAARNR
jgi:GT2 family glycosyltransferase